MTLAAAVILATFARPRIEWVHGLRALPDNTVVSELKPVEIIPPPAVKPLDVLRSKGR